MHLQLQFEKQPISCLQTIKRETQSQEQTQEVRIRDGMPDIGRIVGTWGQVILRGKEWQGDGMTVTGGTMVWVQYLPEEGGEPCVVESWLPFQMHWSLPPTEHDGVIMAQGFLCAADARSTSARKMMLRTNVSVWAWAMENRKVDLFVPPKLEDDIQLRKEKYPVLLPVAAGEKAFPLEETFTLPPSAPKMEKLMHFHLDPEIAEEKLLGDKLVFRGNAILHILYLSADGAQYAWDFDLPFTQYGELEREYDENAQRMLIPAVTSMELDVESDHLNLKAGLVCQYRICEENLVELVTDAYSTGRNLTTELENLELPSILEVNNQMIHAQASFPLDGMYLTDICFLPRSVYVRNTGEQAIAELAGQFQVLYYDMDRQPHASLQKWEETLTLPVGEGCVIEAVLSPVGKPQGNLMSGTAQLNAELQLTLQTRSSSATPMLTKIQLGELEQPDPQRPSLILLRPGDKDLWQLAKENGSTMDAIRSANNLQEAPEADRMLLIPVV